jgi:predicted alpha/beta hydrolase family esterase
MKRVILVHGCCDKHEFFSEDYPTMTNSHWFLWLKEQFLESKVNVQIPEMPDPYDPKYKDWKKIIDGLSINSKTILVGHSCGGGFLLRWLGENNAIISKLILVAPWLGLEGGRSKFLTFDIDPNIQNRIGEMHVFYSSDDDTEGVKESVNTILRIFPKVKRHFFKDKGHFTYNDMQKTSEFPELRDIILETDSKKEK